MWFPSHRIRDSAHYKDSFYNRTFWQQIGFSGDSDVPSLAISEQCTTIPRHGGGERDSCGCYKLDLMASGLPSMTF